MLWGRDLGAKWVGGLASSRLIFSHTLGRCSPAHSAWSRTHPSLLTPHHPAQARRRGCRRRRCMARRTSHHCTRACPCTRTPRPTPRALLRRIWRHTRGRRRILSRGRAGCTGSRICPVTVMRLHYGKGILQRANAEGGGFRRVHVCAHVVYQTSRVVLSTHVRI